MLKHAFKLLVFMLGAWGHVAWAHGPNAMLVNIQVPWFAVVAAAALGTTISIAIAVWLGSQRIAKSLDAMVSLSAGVLLATALLHLLPEAMDKGLNHHDLFKWLLFGLLSFFVLEKFSIFRHSHHHEHDGHHHEHGFDKHEARRGGLLIVVGDSIHNFADGLLIASAFLVDYKLGLLTTLSIAMHEIPQQTGDYLVLRNAGLSKNRAVLLMCIAGSAALLGAMLGYTVLKDMPGVLPIALVWSAASFLYVAVADLIPQMQHRINPKATAIQLSCIMVGIWIVAYFASVFHNH